MVTTLRDIVEDLADKVNRRLDQDSVDPEVKASALAAIREIGGEGQTLESVLRDDAREEFIVDFLARERARFKADTVADLPAWVDTDSVRDDALCDCRVDCPVKHAQLPEAVRGADLLRKGCRQYKQAHQGHPQALEAANHAFDRKVAEARGTLQECITALSGNVTVGEVRAMQDDENGEESSTTDDTAGEAPADD